jgi:hypothetical protein
MNRRKLTPRPPKPPPTTSKRPCVKLTKVEANIDKLEEEMAVYEKQLTDPKVY